MNARHDPQTWARLSPFDPSAGTVIRRPPSSGNGYWVGAPGVTYDESDESFYLVYRIRRPRGVAPDRGGEVHIARSRDGVNFDTIWTGTKQQLSTPSIERCALRRLDTGRWVLYISYVDPADGRWRTDLVEAAQPDKFDLQQVVPVFSAQAIGAEGVKDPYVFRVAGLFHMILSFATTTVPATAEQLHSNADAYNTGLIRSTTGLASSDDGVTWRWDGEIFAPQQTGWDQYCSRIGCIWRQDGVWLAIYDGSADVSENYEERAGLAFSLDLKTFHRVSRNGPFMCPPREKGALRYFDVLAFADVTHFYYEMALPDGSHDLRVFRALKTDMAAQHGPLHRTR